MPGLTNNDHVTEALNQLITATNDINTQLTAISGKIDSIDTSLPEMVGWQEYLKYLKIIAESSNVGELHSDNSFVGDLNDPVVVTGKCRVSNALYDHIYYCCDRAIEKITGLATDNAGLLIQIANIFSSFRSPISYNDFSGLLLVLIDNTVDFSGLCTKLTTAKSAIVTDIFAATTGEQVKAAFFDNLSLTTGQTLWLHALLLPSGVTSSVLNEDYWYSWPDPATPVTCGDYSADCLNEHNRPLGTFWGKGTPSRLSGDTFTSGSTTGQWDYTVYLIAFGCMGDPIPIMTINSISTPSVDVFVESCDGTEFSQNEVLAAAFPMTFHNVVYVNIGRTSSAPTVSFTFTY